MKDEAYIPKRFERVEELGRQVLSSVCVGGVCPVIANSQNARRAICPNVFR